MNRVVLGVYDVNPSGGSAQEGRRRAQILAHCHQAGLPAPSFSHPSFVMAAVEARELVRVGTPVVLVGALSDLPVPAPAPGQPLTFTSWEWREAWLARLDEDSIGWSSIEPRVGEEAKALSTTSVIRSFRRACTALSKAIARARTQRTIAQRHKATGISTQGRPPYGYCMLEGALCMDPVESRRVKQVFESIRQGLSVSATARHMAETEPKKDPEFWDSVKVRRILAHAPLYCLGIRQAPGGKEEQVDSWCFLPEDWADTPSLPAQRRKGTLVPAPATP